RAACPPDSPLAFMYVCGRSTATGPPPARPCPSTAFQRVWSSGTPSLRAASSATRNPALCRVAAYFWPGFPRPTRSRTVYFFAPLSAAGALAGAPAAGAPGAPGAAPGAPGGAPGAPGAAAPGAPGAAAAPSAPGTAAAAGFRLSGEHHRDVDQHFLVQAHFEEVGVHDVPVHRVLLEILEQHRARLAAVDLQLNHGVELVRRGDGLLDRLGIHRHVERLVVG